MEQPAIYGGDLIFRLLIIASSRQLERNFVDPGKGNIRSSKEMTQEQKFVTFVKRNEQVKKHKEVSPNFEQKDEQSLDLAFTLGGLHNITPENTLNGAQNSMKSSQLL